MPPPRKASQACRACRRLKRRCTKDLPSCSLCVRLAKVCEYYPDSAGLDPGITTTTGPAADRLRDPERPFSLHGPLQAAAESTQTPVASASPPFFIQGPGQPFPASFFLDADFFTPLHPDALSWSSRPLLSQQQVASSGQMDSDRMALCDRYFSTTHQWIPMVSRKRLVNELQSRSAEVDGCQDLLLLGMKLCCATTPESGRPAESPLYALTRSLCSTAESSGFVSLRLVQSLVLLTVYELSHAIYPAAYLTVGRAARLGALVGVSGGEKGRLLFKPAETWTAREEQRRTWWAIFVLDKLIHLETRSLSFAVPEPASDELLPVNDEDWYNGRIVPSEPLFTTSFSSVTALGPFARMCQAAHMLGKVVHHKEARRLSPGDVAVAGNAILHEAQQLHRALSALHLSIDGRPPEPDGGGGSLAAPGLAALAICVSARLLLYNQYACNEEPSGAVRASAAAADTEMQALSLDGIRALASYVVPRMAQAGSRCPLLAQCFYHAATECAWFVREDHQPEMKDALGRIVHGLENIAEHWAVGAEYISLLGQGRTLSLIDHEFHNISSPSAISERQDTVSGASS